MWEKSSPWKRDHPTYQPKRGVMSIDLQVSQKLVTYEPITYEDRSIKTCNMGFTSFTTTCNDYKWNIERSSSIQYIYFLLQI